MDGLDRIIGEIKKSAEDEANKIVDDANKEADRILANAEDEAKVEYDKASAESKEYAGRITASADSFAVLDKSNRRLAEKRRLIDESFELAKSRLSNLPSDEYFEVVKKLILKYAADGKGVVLMNTGDLKRVSPGFEMVVNSALPDNKTIEISDKADDSISSGCRIIYGNIEMNCEFSSLIDESREFITGDVAQILFG
jgi:vacuolar-type H+-ATPase subunit E/Vma4